MNGLDELFLSFEIANDFATQKQFFFLILQNKMVGSRHFSNGIPFK